MTQSIRKRPACSTCLRPQSTCICRWITRTELASEVVFLQHPMEVGNAKGSARLLHLSLPGSRLIVGETFPEQELQALLHAPFPHPHGDESPRKICPILLYPDTPQDKIIFLPSIPAETISHEPMQYRLIALDGTWRKSRKMLALNPLLQQLPRLPLRNMPASHYRIRRAHKPDQLSTFEACCYALMQLEPDEKKYQPLLTAFDGFVMQQMSYADAGGASDGSA